MLTKCSFVVAASGTGWVSAGCPCSLLAQLCACLLSVAMAPATGLCHQLAAQCGTGKHWEREAGESTQTDTVWCFPQLDGTTPSARVADCHPGVWLRAEGQLCYPGERI